MADKKWKHVAPETLGNFQNLNFEQPEVSQDTIDRAIANLAKQGESKDEMVQLVNARMGNTQIDVPQGVGIAKVKLEAFEVSPPVLKSYGEQIVNSQNERILRGRQSRRLGETQVPDLMILAAAAPPNYKKKVFNDQVTGKSWEMDQYRPKSGTLRPDGKPLWLSEEQAFYIISKMVSPEAIQRYVREFDSRYIVVQFANRVVQYREESMLNRLGMTTGLKNRAMI